MNEFFDSDWDGRAQFYVTKQEQRNFLIISSFLTHWGKNCMLIQKLRYNEVWPEEDKISSSGQK